jgi:hypothetical protein
MEQNHQNGHGELDEVSLERLSALLQGLARQIGAISRVHADSADFVDLLEASDATWRAAVALDRVAQSGRFARNQASASSPQRDLSALRFEDGPSFGRPQGD